MSSHGPSQLRCGLGSNAAQRIETEASLRHVDHGRGGPAEVSSMEEYECGVWERDLERELMVKPHV